MNLTDIMILSLLFEDAMKYGSPSVIKHARQKPSGQHFGRNQSGSSSKPVLMKLHHLKPQNKSRRDISKLHCNRYGQMVIT